MSHQNNSSVNTTNSTTSLSMATTFSPVKQELHDNFISSDCCEIPRDVSNSSLDRRRSSGSITMLSNYEDSRHDLVKDGELPRHYSFSAQNKIITNMRFSQGINSVNTKNVNQVGCHFINPKEEQQCVNSSMLISDKEKQKQTKNDNAGFGIEEKPLHECDACGKRLCSSRSLKRHKSTCKRVKAVIEQTQVSGGFNSPPPVPAENISENKAKEQNVQKQIQKHKSSGNLISDNNKNEKVNLNQPIRQCSSEYISTQPFCLAQPPPQNCSSKSFSSNNNSPIEFCNIIDPQNCGGLSSPPLNLQQQQQFYSRQPYSSAQIQVLQQENNFKKDEEKLKPITASDEPNKVSDVVDSVVAKLRLQSGGVSSRIPTTNCITTPCNIPTTNINNNNNSQQLFLPQQKHFNVPIEWNEGNIPIQQLGESQQSTTPITMFYYTHNSQQQQQQFQQQRQQYFVGDNSNRTTEILPTQQNQLNNQIELTKCSQSKSSTTMPLQQNSWQTINPQLVHQQPQPINLHRNSSGENNLMSPPIISSSDGAIISGRIGQQNEKCTPLYSCNNEQIKKQKLIENSGNVKNTLTETEKPPTSLNVKSTIISPPPPVQQQRPRANSGNTSKNVYRYLCPECDKPYSCRKNVKRHRISQHKVPAQEAQDGQIKRIRLTEEDLQKDENVKLKQSSVSKSKEIEKEQNQQSQLKEKKLTRDEMSRQNSSTSLTSPLHQNILQSPDHQQQQPPFAVAIQKQQNFQKQPSMQNLRDERQFQHPQTQQRHPYYFQYPPINQSQQEQRFVGQQHIYETQNSFYELPQQTIQPQQYIQGQQQQQLIYQDSQQQKKFQQQQQYYGSQMITTYPPPPQQQQNQQQKIIMVQQQQCNHQNTSEIVGYNIQQQPGPSNRSNNNIYYSNNNNYPQQYTMINNNSLNNEFPVTYQEGYYHQQIEQQQRQFIGGQQEITYNNNNTYSDTLDCWEQIKPDVDTGPTIVDPDAMARIVADLKQTEEVTEKHQQARIVQQQQTIKRQQKQQQNLQFCHLDNGMIVNSNNIDNTTNTTAMFNQQSGIQRKAVELAEADTTFSPPSQPDDSINRQISQQSHQGVATQQFQQKMIPLNHQIKHPTQQSPTTYHQPIMSASSHPSGQQNVFRFDIGTPVTQIPKELNSIEHEKFQQIEWNYQSGINNNNLISQNKYQQQQHSQTLQSPSFSLTNIPQENVKLTNQKIKKESLTNSQKKQIATCSPTKITQQSSGTFVCPSCTKAYSTDYSLKRHKNVCPVLVGKPQTEKRGNTSRKRKNVNVPTSSFNNNNNGSMEKIIGNIKTDEPHQIDPDSTMNESPPNNVGGSNSLINSRRLSVSGTNNTISAIGGNNNGDSVEEKNKPLQLQMATVIQL